MVTSRPGEVGKNVRTYTHYGQSDTSSHGDDPRLNILVRCVCLYQFVRSITTYKCLFLAYRTLWAAVSGQLTYIYNGSVVSEGFQLNAGLQPSQIRVDCVLAEIRAANGFAAFVQKNT